MKTILHISTSHYPNDNRIYYKEIIGASRLGYNIAFIVPTDEETISKHCDIIGLQRSGSKIRRYIINQLIGFYWISKMKPDIVQFHDPELVFLGYLMSFALRGTHFIYDVHEDNYTALRNRGNPKKFALIKHIIAGVVRWFELRLHKRVSLVIAEKYYGGIFPEAIEVLNYPILTSNNDSIPPASSEYHELIYTGNVTIERGLDIYKQLVQANKRVRVHLVGRISSSVARQIHQELGDDQKRLVIPFVDEFVDPQVLQAYYQSQVWTAGLAIFPPNEHYFEKELTKLFEYMMNSIPVVCSNFPVWENIVLRHAAGLSVSPENISDISNTIDKLGQDGARVIELGDNGFKALTENYLWADQQANLTNLYERILKD